MKIVYLISFVCFVLFAIFLAKPALAQSKKEDAVYLKNGSIIRGKILETIVGKTIRIETVGRNVLVLPESDIEHVVLDEPMPVLESNEANHSGYNALADVGFLGGNDNNLSLMLTNSWQFKNRISVGAGFGIEKFGYQVMPVYADVRYNFLKGNISPFIYMQGGYAFPLGSSKEEENYKETNLEGGGLLNPGIGLQFNFSKRNALIVSLGWRYQELHKKWEYTYWYYSADDQSYEGIDFYRRIAIRIGFIFN